MRHNLYRRFLEVRKHWWNTCFQGNAQYHCPACGYANPQEAVTLQHCREQHPQEGRLQPYSLQRDTDKVQFVGPSCAVSAVVSVLSHLEEEKKSFHPMVRQCYTQPSRQATQALVQGLQLSLPTAPATVLEALGSVDPGITRCFQAAMVQAWQCRRCGRSEGNMQQQGARPHFGLLKVQPTRHAPIELSHGQLAAAYTEEVLDPTVPCVGPLGGPAHHPQATALVTARTFGDAVALEIGLWGEEQVGLKRIPADILLPHGNGSATYELVGAVIAATPTHVVAAIPRTVKKRRRWDIIDGMVKHTVSDATVDPRKVVLCIYRRQEEERRALSNDTLLQHGLVRCDKCSYIIPASDRARATHVPN
ncbi:unnamed protein product [Trypanosoma congolense IL3000]|uniref:WGS project CAEQ00000000 data, annotated contig 1789 n=1 Tax=Trypanosoma congolense (strain IL3000) TaxID=1068625 RepID=F9W8W1_TRYCI|nr:unnamed protein product [Trypanosoma congolense IL3000]